MYYHDESNNKILIPLAIIVVVLIAYIGILFLTGVPHPHNVREYIPMIGK